MSIYSDPRSSASRSGYSMGERMRSGGAFVNAGSATFDKVSAQLTARVREELSAEQQRRAEAQGLPVPHAVTAHQLSVLQNRYPEFTLIGMAMWSGVHVQLEAERLMASALCMQRLSGFTAKVTAMGNAFLPAAFLRMRHAHLEMSGRNAYAVHANHSAQEMFMKMARMSSQLQQEHSYTFDSGLFKDFLRGRVLQVCDSSETCGAHGGAYFVDTSIYPVSVYQYCAGMAADGAVLGEAIIPFSPEMLVHPEGEWGDTGAHYALTDDDLVLKYADGVAGANRFNLGAWNSWLRSGGCTVNHAGQAHNYEVELSGVRGSFLFASITRVETLPPPSSMAYRTHALELPQRVDRYFVRSYRLKSLSLDPTKRASYEPFCYMPSKRLADKVFVHALRIPPESFKDAAVFKRVTVLDGRVTFAGTSVAIDRPVAIEEVAQMTQDIVLRAFVARYNMGTLGSDLMSSLSDIKGFAAASNLGKVAYLACAMFKCAWSWTFGLLIDAVKSVVRMGLRFITRRGGEPLPDFSPAPTFVLFETYTRWLSTNVYSRASADYGGNLLVPYIKGATLAYKSRGNYVPPARPYAPVVRPPSVNVSLCGLDDTIQDTREPAPVSQKGAAFVKVMVELNGVGTAPHDRFDLPVAVTPETGDFDFGVEDYVYDINYINTINVEHEKAFPGMRLQNFEADLNSLHFDPQEWNIDANYLRMPAVGQRPQLDMEVYKSNVHTYRVERKMQTLPVLLHAMNERNLSIPKISANMNIGVVVEDTWENFIEMCCKPEARNMLAKWKVDRVGLEAEVLGEWTKKAASDKLDRMLDKLAVEAKSLEEMDVGDFEVMVKSDAKPPLSTKPLHSQLAPQVIVYHDSTLSALYSSIFRVLTRRFLALLRDEWMVNMTKSMEDVRRHFTKYYPWDGDANVRFLENDFSKYDKSQTEMCVRLEQFVNEKLGFDLDLLAKWYAGHEQSTIHSVQQALRMKIDWQRRSGGGNTAFGNVTVNLLTTAFAYRGTQVRAAAYIGDDSLIMTDLVSASQKSIGMLSEMYNLQAKFYLSDDPYFASNFLLFDKVQRQAIFAPDPIKRAQRVGLSVNAKNPNWEDRIRSHQENCHVYKFRKIQKMLDRPVRVRYELPEDSDVGALCNALATSSGDKETREIWEPEPTVVTIL